VKTSSTANRNNDAIALAAFGMSFLLFLILLTVGLLPAWSRWLRRFLCDWKINRPVRIQFSFAGIY
jgi:hypothetical protein